MTSGYGYGNTTNSGYGNNSYGYGGSPGGGLGGGGGGFISNSVGGGFQAGSPTSSPASKRGGPSNQSLRPVTIKQLGDATQDHNDAPFKIDGAEISQITFVANIRSAQEQSTNVAYVMEDGTGIIDVRQWLDPETSDGTSDYAAQRRAECRTETYVRVVGQLRAFQNKRNVVAYSIRPIKDFNEITFHNLEAIYAHLWTINGPLNVMQPQQQQQMQNSYQIGMGSYGGGAMSNAGYGGHNAYNSGPTADIAFGGDFTPIQQQILQVVKSASHTNEGMHVQQIHRQLGGMHKPNSISMAIEWLTNEGHLFVTIDDDHVKCVHN